MGQQAGDWVSKRRSLRIRRRSLQLVPPIAVILLILAVLWWRGGPAEGVRCYAADRLLAEGRTAEAEKAYAAVLAIEDAPSTETRCAATGIADLTELQCVQIAQLDAAGHTEAADTLRATLVARRGSDPMRNCTLTVSETPAAPAAPGRETSIEISIDEPATWQMECILPALEAKTSTTDGDASTIAGVRLLPGEPDGHLIQCPPTTFRLTSGPTAAVSDLPSEGADVDTDTEDLADEDVAPIPGRSAAPTAEPGQDANADEATPDDNAPIGLGGVTTRIANGMWSGIPANLLWPLLLLLGIAMLTSWSAWYLRKTDPGVLTSVDLENGPLPNGTSGLATSTFTETAAHMDVLPAFDGSGMEVDLPWSKLGLPSGGDGALTSLQKLATQRVRYRARGGLVERTGVHVTFDGPGAPGPGMYRPPDVGLPVPAGLEYEVGAVAAAAGLVHASETRRSVPTDADVIRAIAFIRYASSRL